MKQLTTSLFFTLAFIVSGANMFAQTYHEGNWYSLYQSEFSLETKVTSWTGVQQDFTVFAPTNGNLQFDYLYVIWGGGLGNLSKVQNTHIYESADNGANLTEMAIVEGTDTENPMNASVSLSSNINFIRFDRPRGNTNSVQYTNVRLPLAYHILFAEGEYGANAGSMNFEEKKIGEVSEAQSISLRSFYAANDITITCQNPDVFRIGSPDNTNGLTWAIGPNACASQNGQDSTPAGGEVLGDIALYDIVVYFCPQHAIEYTDTIIITDGNTTATIVVSGKGLPIEQTITWELNTTTLVVDNTLPLNATASSGLEVTYTITEGQDVVAIEGNNIIAKKAGTTTITASQVGNNNYLAAETVAHTITVEKATPQITELPTIAPVTYGTTLEEALVLNGGKASVEGTFAITKPTAEEMTQVWDAGQYTINIVFTPALADAYNIVEATTKLLIEQATQTIAWTIDTNTLLVNETLPLNATASSGLEVTYTITEGQDVIAIEGNNLVAKKAGTATITALQTGNNNYLAAESITHTITVEKATQTITWIIDATTLLVNETLPLNATASSGLEVTYTITEGQDVVAIEGNNLVAKKAGTATITASQAGNTDYLAAESVAHTITVEKATPQITELPTIAPVTYGTTLAEALILNGGKASVDGTFAIAIPSHEDYLQQVWDAGKHTIGIIFYPTQEEAYHSIDTTIVLLIEQAAQTITWTLDSTNLFVNDTLILTAAASSELEITYEVTGDEGVVTIEDNLLIAIQTGTITITASQTGNNNYLAAESVAYTLTIEDMPSAIIDIHINSHHTKKIIHGEKIYILHNGVYYDILGNTIK